MADHPPTREAAFSALTKYEQGSDRGSLLAIDEAVVAALDDAVTRPLLEQRLLGVLKSSAPTAAREYACRKLALIGSAASIQTLAALLSDQALADPARNALQSIPGAEVDDALRRRLPQLRGKHLAGAIDSLGARRDVKSVSGLARLLSDSDPLVAGAAAAALGSIGDGKAERALLRFLPKATGTAHGAAMDAALACAERRLESGQKAEARKLCQTLLETRSPKHVAEAARRSLARAGA